MHPSSGASRIANLGRGGGGGGKGKSKGVYFLMKNQAIVM